MPILTEATAKSYWHQGGPEVTVKKRGSVYRDVSKSDVSNCVRKVYVKVSPNPEENGCSSSSSHWSREGPSSTVTGFPTRRRLSVKTETHSEDAKR